MSDPNAKAVQGGPTGNPDPQGAGELVQGQLNDSPLPEAPGQAGSVGSVDPERPTTRLGDVVQNRGLAGGPGSTPQGTPGNESGRPGDRVDTPVEGGEPAHRRPGWDRDARGKPQPPGKA